MAFYSSFFRKGFVTRRICDRPRRILERLNSRIYFQKYNLRSFSTDDWRIPPSDLADNDDDESIEELRKKFNTPGFSFRKMLEDQGIEPERRQDTFKSPDDIPIEYLQHEITEILKSQTSGGKPMFPAYMRSELLEAPNLVKAKIKEYFQKSDMLAAIGLSKHFIASISMDVILSLAESRCKTEDDRVSLLCPQIPHVGEKVQYQDIAQAIVVSRTLTKDDKGEDTVALTLTFRKSEGGVMVEGQTVEVFYALNSQAMPDNLMAPDLISTPEGIQRFNESTFEGFGDLEREFSKNGKV